MAIIARRFLPLLAFAVLLVAGGEAGAHSQEHHTAPKASCDSPELHCATKASAAFAPDGTLWLTWAAEGASQSPSPATSRNRSARR